MAVQVETLDKLERRITLTLPASRIASEVESRLKPSLAHRPADGFRPGKVPMSVVSQRYGYRVEQRSPERQGRSGLLGGGQRGQLRVAGHAEITEKAEAPEGVVAFDATFEIYPEVMIGDLAAAKSKPSG